jgi:hypothetical protein
MRRYGSPLSPDNREANRQFLHLYLIAGLAYLVVKSTVVLALTLRETVPCPGAALLPF